MSQTVSAAPPRQQAGPVPRARSPLRSAARRGRWAGVFFLAALTLAILGQRLIATGAYPADGAALLLAAGGLLLMALVQPGGALAASLLTGPAASEVAAPTETTTARPRPPVLPTFGPHRARTVVLIICLLCVLVAFTQSSGNRFRPLGVVTWLLAIATFLAAYWQPPYPRLTALGRLIRSWRAGIRLHLSWPTTIFLAIWALGCFLLLYRLDAVPEEMISDHAEKLLDVKDVLAGQHKIFFERNTGREAFQFYLAAIMASAGLGLSFMTLKASTVVLGILAIPATYGFARVWFGPVVALAATFFLAVSRWQLTVARAGLRFPFLPVFFALTCFFLLRALRYRQRNDFLLLGLVVGIGMHTYTPFRVAPLAVAACLGLELLLGIIRRQDQWQQIRAALANAGLAAAVAALVFLPLGAFSLERPDLFWYRGLTRVSTLERQLPGHPAGIFLDNVKNALLMFNYRGDRIWNSNVPNDRVFDYVTGALFALGSLYALYRLLRHGERVYGYLVILLFVGLLPSTLALAFPQENPSTVRSGMALPIGALVAALPIGLLANVMRRPLPGARGVAVLALILIPLGAQTVQLNFQRYFVDFAQSHKGHSQNSWEVAKAINGFAASSGDISHAWLKGWPHWVDTRLVALQIGDPDWQNSVADIAQVRQHETDGTAHLYVVNINDRQSQADLQTWYPTATVRDHLSPVSGEVLFRTYLTPPLRQ